MTGMPQNRTGTTTTQTKDGKTMGKTTPSTDTKTKTLDKEVSHVELL